MESGMKRWWEVAIGGGRCGFDIVGYRSFRHWGEGYFVGMGVMVFRWVLSDLGVGCRYV